MNELYPHYDDQIARLRAVSAAHLLSDEDYDWLREVLEVIIATAALADRWAVIDASVEGFFAALDRDLHKDPEA